MKIRSIITSLVVIASTLFVSSTSMAGDARGSQYWAGLVPARDYVDILLILNGKEQTTVTVRGDGDTDLDCFIYDENGNEADRDVDDTDRCVLQVRPRWTGKFSVRIRNQGGISNRAVMVTN